MLSNENIKQEILKIISRKDIQSSEEYIRKINRTELTAELMDQGFDKEQIELQLAALCENGAFALDEQNVYQYEEI